MIRHRTRIFSVTTSIRFGFITLAFFSSMESTKAAGKSRSDVVSNAVSTPKPIRKVLVRKVGTQVFVMPGQTKPTDLSYDLGSILETSLSETQFFAPSVGLESSARSCQRHLEIQAVVSSFELNLTQFGISMGWSPDGGFGRVSSIAGKTKVKVGNIQMDFQLIQVEKGVSTVLAATYATHKTANTETELEVDFAGITAGPSLVTNSAIGSILRKIMQQGVSKLAAKTGVDRAAWSATVRTVYNQEGSTVLFNAGFVDGIAPNQAFTVYAADTSGSGCDVYLPVADIVTNTVDTFSSFARVEKIRSSARGIKEGDMIVIQYKP